MGETPHHQQITKKLVIKDEFVKKDGTSGLYIYVSVDGQWDRIPLKLYWPPTFFDKDAGKLLARKKDDADLTDYTVMIETELGKLNEIIKTYRLSERKLTLAILLSEYYSYTSRLDFLTWWDADLKERKKRKKIEDVTARGHRSALNKLRDFWQAETKTVGKTSPPLPFVGLTPKLLENFRAWLKTAHNDGPGTVAKEMTRLRTYIKRALVAKYVFEDPFKVVKIKKPETYPNVLEQEQLLALIDLYHSPEIRDSWQTILRHFLFSCFTGLRISDIHLIEATNIQDDWLVLKPKKTFNIRKVVRIPLHPQAKNLVESTLIESKLFETYSEQYTNRQLGQISQTLELGWKMTTHTARHTFGTLFIELGGDVVTLKDYMGHSDIKTTMKYVHLSESKKKEKIQVFDKLFTKNTIHKSLNPRTKTNG